MVDSRAIRPAPSRPVAQASDLAAPSTVRGIERRTMSRRASWMVAVSMLVFQLGIALAQPYVEEGYVPVAEGVALYYVKYGQGAPDLIVSNAVYTAVPLAGLADGRTVVFFDTRGRGLSTPVRDGALLGAEEEIHDYGRVQDHFGAERVAVLGWSLWGNFAQVYAARNPDRVSSVVAFGPSAPALRPYASMPPLSPGPNVARLNQYLQSADEDADPYELCLGAKEILMPSQVADDSILTDLNRKLCALPNERDDNIGFILGELFRSLGDWNWLDAFAEIDVPVLIVHGDQDTVIPEGVEANVQALADGDLVVTEDSGHMGFIEHPERYVRVVDEFLDSHR